MDKTDRVLSRMNKEPRNPGVVGSHIDLPNYSVVTGARQVHAQVNNLQVGNNASVTGTLGVTGTTTLSTANVTTLALSGAATTTYDNSSADTAYIPMVLYNTDATPPAANTVPIGTIYIQYTP